MVSQHKIRLAPIGPDIPWYDTADNQGLRGPEQINGMIGTALDTFNDTEVPSPESPRSMIGKAKLFIRL